MRTGAAWERAIGHTEGWGRGGRVVRQGGALCVLPKPPWIGEETTFYDGWL